MGNSTAKVSWDLYLNFLYLGFIPKFPVFGIYTEIPCIRQQISLIIICYVNNHAKLYHTQLNSYRTR